MNKKSIRALLLSAGYGTRLRPITNKTPKCLVEINGVPLLKHWIDTLHIAGIKSLMINTHYLASQVKSYINSLDVEDMEIIISHEETLLGTAGTLMENINFFDKDIGLIIHADNYTQLNINDLVNAHINKNNDCLITMLTFTTDNPTSCGIVKINNKGIVQHFFEKSKENHGNIANGAIYAFDQKFINWIKGINPKPKDFSLDILPLLMGRINTYHTQKSYIDIGTPDSLRKANSIYL